MVRRDVLVLCLVLLSAHALAAVRQLPQQVILQYAVQYGDGGLRLGTATYVWQSANDHYLLSNEAEAQGLASLFVSGKAVQTSEGHIDAGGLRPDNFVVQRNGVRKEFARFDWQARRLELYRGKVEPLTPLTQDLLSLPFHLALTVKTPDNGGKSNWMLPVTNGRSVKDYHFHVVGMERIEVLGKQTEVLHIRATRLGKGGTDVWLDLANHGLPARIRNVDDKGSPIVQTLIGTS